MPMSKEQPMTSREEILTSLRERASELWGSDHAEHIKNTIEPTALHVWRLSQDLPPAETEPGLYL